MCRGTEKARNTPSQSFLIFSQQLDKNLNIHMSKQTLEPFRTVWHKKRKIGNSQTERYGKKLTMETLAREACDVFALVTTIQCQQYLKFD